MASVTALIEVLSIVVVNYRFQRNADHQIRGEFAVAHRRADGFQRLSLENLVTLASNIAQDPRLRGSIVTGDRETIGQAVNEVHVHYSSNLFWLLTPTGVLIARVEKPEQWGDTLSARAVIEDARNGFDSGDIWLWEGELYQVAAVPIRSGEFTVGLLVVGQEFDRHLTSQFAKLAGLELAFVGSDGVLSSSAGGEQRRAFGDTLLEMHRRAELTTMGAPRFPMRDSPDSAMAPFLNFEVGDEPFGGCVFKLCDVAGAELAAGLIYRSLAPERLQLARIQFGLLVVDLLAILLIFVAAYLISRRITSPMERLVEASAKLGAGDLDSPIRPEGMDEIGALARAHEEMRVSLKKVREELIQGERLSTIGRMASSIIHDFRQPISVIYGYLDLLTLPGTPLDKVESYKESIFKQFDRMLGMINELLDFARGEARLKPGPVRLSQFISEIARGFERDFRARNVSFSTKLDWDGDLTIDAARLQRGVENIIRNAMQVLKAGGTIDITSAGEADNVCISIHDSGPGIPAEIVARIFEPFVTFGKSEGTGLGLAVAQRVVVQHGGSISVESVPGEGATFHIRLPVGSTEGA